MPEDHRTGFRERILSGSVIIGDGATATGLQRRGLPIRTAPEGWTFDRPDDVQQLASDYAKAGAEVVLTNTFGGNRIRWRETGRSEPIDEVNKRAVGLARAGVGEGRYVVGSVGPTGEDLPEATWREVYETQVRALVKAGVDGVCVETVCRFREGLAAVNALRAISDIPVILSFTLRIGSGLETFSGEPIQAAVAEASDSGVDVIGVNCVGFDRAKQAVEQFREITELPIAVSPNAGVPECDGLSYPDAEEDLARKAAGLVRSGVRIISGCCGTGPRYVEALRKAIKEQT